MKIKKQILIMCNLLLTVVFTQAQNSTNSSGGEALGSGGSLSYSVGQVVYRTHSGLGGSIANGVQQTYEIFITTGIEYNQISLVQISVYPNPVTNLLKLSIEMERSEELSFQLFDVQGKLLQRKRITDLETQINMSDYVSSIYFIKVYLKDKSIKEFKIIKN